MDSSSIASGRSSSPGPTTARLEIELGPAGWPFGGLVRQEIAVSAVAIELTAEVVAGDQAMPVSLGWHPWFTRSSRGDSSLRVPAAETLETEPDLIPTGRRVLVDNETDLREGPLLAGRRLDHTYVDVGGPVDPRAAGSADRDLGIGQYRDVRDPHAAIRDLRGAADRLAGRAGPGRARRRRHRSHPARAGCDAPGHHHVALVGTEFGLTRPA